MHENVGEKDTHVLLLDLTTRRFTCNYFCMFMEL